MVTTASPPGRVLRWIVADVGQESVPWGTIAPGRQIGKYQILQHMATGGMAEIYLARSLGIHKFQKLVVIKRILPGQAHDAALRNMLLDEARIAATLHHSNIVQVFDIGEASGEYFYCMEYLHGRDVASVVAATRRKGVLLAEDQALSIILGMCAGLHYAHDKTDDQDRPLGIVHRDISPTNVFVTFDGGVKLLDFGLVKAEGRATESRSGALKGKLAYMSPEQCRAKPCDRRSDLFAVGIMLWELTTGKRLFTGDCDFDFLTAILEQDIPRPSTVYPGYPDDLERITMKALERDPARRYATAEELQLDLEEYARDRKVRISPITLRQMMDHLFDEDLASWHAARRAGVALEDHIIEHIPLAEGSLALTGSERELGSNRAGPVAPPIATSVVAASLPAAPRRRSGIAWVLGIGLLAAGGGGAYVWSTRTPGTRATGEEAAAPAAVAPAAPAQTTPAPAPPAPPVATPPATT